MKSLTPCFQQSWLCRIPKYGVAPELIGAILDEACDYARNTAECVCGCVCFSHVPEKVMKAAQSRSSPAGSQQQGWQRIKESRITSGTLCICVEWEWRRSFCFHWLFSLVVFRQPADVLRAFKGQGGTVSLQTPAERYVWVSLCCLLLSNLFQSILL